MDHKTFCQYFKHFYIALKIEIYIVMSYTDIQDWENIIDIWLL